MSKTDYDAFLKGDGDFEAVSKKVYQHFEDRFDFIFILSVEETQPEDLYYGITYPVQNTVQGIGNTTFNNTATYGSAGKLKSIIHMPRSEYIQNGPFFT